MVQSSYLLARAFGWTPGQVRELTMAQASIYLQLLEREAALVRESGFSFDR